MTIMQKNVPHLFQNFRKILRVDPESYKCHASSSNFEKNASFVPKMAFLKIIIRTNFAHLLPLDNAKFQKNPLKRYSDLKL